MIIEWLYLLILSASLFMNIIIIGLAWTKWTTLAGRWYIMIVSIISITLMSFLFFSIGKNNDVIFFWVRIRLVALSLLPYLVIGFISAYTDHFLRFKSMQIPLLFVPIITNIVIWFAPSLFWESWDILSTDVLNMESAVYTGWFVVHSIYAFICFLSAIIIALRYVMQVTANSRRQMITIIVAIVLPLGVVIMPITGLTSGSLNPFPISLSLSALLYGWALLKEGLLKLSPLAYNTIIENMVDAVFVFDAQNCLLLLNESAKKVIEIEDRQLVLGRHAKEVFLNHEDLVDQYKDLWEIQMETSVILDETRYIFDIRLSPIRNDRGENEFKLLILRDITQSKQAEEALRRSELQYRSLFEQQNDAVFIVDIAGKYLKINQRAADMLGYTMEEALQLSISDVSIELDDSYKMIEQLLAKKTIPTYEKHFRHKEGHIFPVEISTAMVWDDNGEAIHIQSIVRDISERKQAETALRESEMLYRSLFQQPNDGVFILTLTGEYVSVNERGARMFGYTLEEFLESHFGSLSTDVDLTLHTLDRLLAQEALPPFERVYRHKDGYDLPVEVNAKLIWNDDETPKYVQLIVRDITDRKEAEAAIRESEERQSALIRAIPDMIFVIRKDGTLLNLLLPPSEELAQPDSPLRYNLIKFLSDEPTAKQLEAYQHVLTTREMVIMSLDTIIEDKQYYFEARIVPLNDSEVISIIRDMAEIRQAQKHEFDLALEKERHDLVTSFIQDASHEFRTPLSIISTNLYLLERIDDAQKQKLKIGQIYDQVQRIDNLVSMMLKITQLDNMSSTLQAVSILPFIQSLVVIWQSRSSTPIHIHPNLLSSLQIMGDHEILREAFSILIDNAIRFGKEDNAIDIRLSHKGTTLTISIEDKGVGIPQDAIPYIFDSFWRSDLAHTTPGLGLGLSMAQKIIKLHNGVIQVESEVDKGSRFDIILPLASDSL